jgi:ABC-type uncharacterized transport system auxiliary subunit
MRRWAATLAFVLGLAGCVTGTPPNDDYNLARAALEAARVVEAARHSPGYYHQAEEAYRKAKLLYEEREFEQAREEFVKARFAAEKAENSARLIRLKNGEVL